MTRFVTSDALKGGEQERLENLVTLWAFGHSRHAKQLGLEGANMESLLWPLESDTDAPRANLRQANGV